MAIVAACGTAGTVLAVLPLTAAVAAETVTLTKQAPDNVLVGEPARMTLTARNSGDTAEYNLTLRDVLASGLTYVAGSTQPASAGEPTVITGSDGRQTLIWDNVSDLPQAGAQSVSFAVTPSTTVYPVGASFTNTGQAYASSDPRTLAKFAATGVYTSGATVQSGSNTTTTKVTAVQVEKLEPSPEHELVRGVHAHTTAYTLRVTNNDHHADNGTVLVDLLPAQLEFLGCGTVDNTPGGSVEYAGAPRLDVSTPDVTSCAAPYSVQTVSNPTGVPAGVYTRVEWHLADLAPGEVRDVVYRAGIPQRANTLTFPGGVPAPTSLGQTANLDNNTGAPTRETAGEQALTNHVTVAAQYQGPVDPSASTSVGDSDDLTVTAEDLAVQKSVSPGTFRQGGIATYTLRLETSEYADARDIVLTDVIPNGLCPLGVAGTNYAGSAPTACDGSATTTPSQPYDQVTENTTDGTFTVVFDPLDVAHDGTATVTYQARMLGSYRGAQSDPTVVGDDYTNHVSLTGTTRTLAAVDAPGGVSDQTVYDDSSATITSNALVLDKRIQPNTGSATPYTCSADEADYRDSSTLPSAQTTFAEGSRVCFLLSIDFPSGNDTKSAILRDFLPDYLTFEPGSAVALAGNDVTTQVDASSLTFTLGDTGPSGARFVPQGSHLRYRVSGIVARSAGGTSADVPGNLAKLRWTNTDGVVGFLRDREDFRVPPPPPVALTKTANRATATAPGTTGVLASGGTVRAGDVVDYAVTVRNSAAADNPTHVVGPDVWDRLPAGIRCAAVSAISDGGVCTDPGDAAQPTFAARATRSAIRWDLPDAVDLAPGGSRAVTYRVTYPASISANRSYLNDVDVASYGSDNNLGGITQHHPASNVDTTVPTADVDAPAAHAAHSVATPQETVTKTNATEVDDTTQGTSPATTHYATVGETVTYQVSATLPASTTVYGGVLTDAPPAGLRVDGVTYEYRDDPSSAYVALPAGWTTSTPPAAAKVTLPASLDTGATADSVRMTVTATVLDAAPNVHGAVRTNTATLTSTDESGAALPTRSGSSSVTVVEPRPALAKVADDDTPGAGQPVTFTLTARNLDTSAPDVLRPTLFGARVVDCVPAALAVQPATITTTTGSATTGAAGTGGCASDRSPVVWDIGDLAWRSTTAASTTSPWPRLSYTVVTTPAAAGGAAYTNTAVLSGTSMAGADPDERSYSATASETVTVPSSALTKTVTPSRVTVGDRAHFTISVDLPQDVNFYDAVLVDQLPAGLDPGSVALTGATCAYADATAGPCGVVPTGADALVVKGQWHGWDLGDVAADARPRTVTLDYTVPVQDVAANTAGTPLTNTAVLHWDQADRVSGHPQVDDTFDASSSPDTATVTVTEPRLSLAKAVTTTTPAPGATFTYRVTVTNATGANVSTAHDIDVSDVVPAGVRVLPGTVSDGGVLNAGSTGGGTIAWSDLGPLAPGASVTLSYDARLVSPAPAAAQKNTATVDAYRSLEGAGRAYDGPSASATITPALPHVTVAKTVLDGPPAYRGAPTRWQIVVTNTGPAVAHDVDVEDTLPADWTYDAGTARVTTPSGTVSLEPSIGSDPRHLSWADLADLTTGQTVTIVLSATPSAAAAVGSGTAHVNDAVATAQDLDGPTGAVVTTAEDDAQTRIDSADVSIDKVAVGTPVAGRDFSWRLTVTDAGADTARGPFQVVDTLPAGVTGALATGAGWTCSTAVPSGAGDPEVVTCVRATATDALAPGGSFAPITVTAAVPATTAAGTTLHNAATVAAATYDPDTSDNSDSTDDDVTVVADMTITKSLVGPLVAGSAATYRLTPRNAGPSVAHGPVVVTDTLPAGLAFDSFTGSDWRLDRSGQDLTFTWTGALPVPVGSLPQIAVTVAVASDRTAAVTNTASVSEPSDPTTGPEEPDTDSVTTTPSTSADLGLAKRSVGDIRAGASGVYELTVTDFGPSDAAGPITVTDDLPTSLTYRSVDSTDGWTCTAAGQQVTCTLADGLAVGDSSMLRLMVDVAEDLTGDVRNTASVDGPTADPNPANDADDDDSGIDVRADLSVRKTVRTDPVVAGEDVTYRLQVRNGGSATSPGTITVVDTLPAGLTFVSAGGAGWACDADGQVVTCDRGASLAADTDAPAVDVVAHVASGVGTTTLVNAASVSGPAADPDPTNNTDHVDTPVTEDAEVSVTKTLTSADPAAAGDEVTFAVDVRSTGASDARGVTVTDVLPTGMTLVSASGTGWSCTATVCTRDRVRAGEAAPTLTVVALVASGTPDGSTLVNHVRVSTVTPGDTPAGNEDDADVDVVARADLALVKEHSGDAVAGVPTTFTITVSDEGPSDSVGPTTVVDTLPAGLSYLSANAPWTCAPDAGDAARVVCTVPDGIVAGSALPILEVQVMVDATADIGTLTNTATVSSPTTDPVPADDTDTADVDVDRQADLAITKTHTGPAHIGDDLAFTLTVTNDGPSSSRGVVVEDALPVGLDPVSADGAGWTCAVTGADVRCELAGELAPGAVADPITVTAHVLAAAYPTVTNAATVSADTVDPDPTDNEAADVVTVPALTDLGVVKKHVGDLVVGEQGTYSIVVTNHGPTAAPGPIALTDTLPTGLRLVSAQGAGWACRASGTTVTCLRAGALAAGASAEVRLVVDVLPAAYPEVANLARVGGPSEDTDATNDTSTDLGHVTPTVRLGLEKRVAGQDGDTVRYRLTVTNEGPSATVRPTTVRDPMPHGLRLQSATGTGWSCVTSRRLATCTYADPIAAGSARSLTVVATLVAAPGTKVTNVATLGGGGSTHSVSDSAAVRVGADATSADPREGSGGKGALARTGGPALFLVPLGLLLVAAGALLLGRRRRS